MDGFTIFLGSYPVRNFTKGDVVLHQDTEPPHAYFIKSGVVKTYNLTSRGEEKPIELSIQNDIFPIGWIFDKIRKTQYYYEAITNTELYCVPKQELVIFLKNNSETMYQLLHRHVERWTHNQMRINALEQSKAVDKIISTLHYFALQFGRDIAHNTIKIPLPLTQQDVANFTGLTRETVSSEFSKLARRNIIGHQDQGYVIYTSNLDELLDDSFERHFVRPGSTPALS